MTNSTPLHESNEAEKGSYASVNGLNMYYEIHGSGEPLMMLHGAFGMAEMYGALLPLLAQSRQVIAVELQAHGHTADIDRPLRYELMADDIAALIKHLELEQADLFGYSLGGGVALQTAIRHPEMIRKLVVVSAPCKRDGWYPEVLAGQAAISAELFAGSPIQEAYVRTAPRPEYWPVLIAKVRQMLAEDYDWTEERCGEQGSYAAGDWGCRRCAPLAYDRNVCATRWGQGGQSTGFSTRRASRNHASEYAGSHRTAASDDHDIPR